MDKNIWAAIRLFASIILLGFFCIGIFYLPFSIGLRLAVITVFLFAAFFAYRFYLHVNWHAAALRKAATRLISLGGMLVLRGASGLLFNPAFEVNAASNGWQKYIDFFLAAFLGGEPWVNLIIIFFGLVSVGFVAWNFKNESSTFINTDISTQGDAVHEKSIQSTQPDNIQRIFDPQKDFYGSDLPPLIECWVGRESELSLLTDDPYAIYAITGIGGQGKSTLAAMARKQLVTDSSVFWDWRDCREESDRFRTQVVSLLERITHKETKAENISDADFKWVVKFFFRSIQDMDGVIVFDNVDSYVNTESSLFTDDISVFVDEALRVEHKMKIVFTCRPRISYASPRFREVYLRGLQVEEVIELFRSRSGNMDITSIEPLIPEIAKHCDGHPMWLSMIAVQVAKKNQSAETILSELRSGKADNRAKAMLRSIWVTLKDDEKTILRYMAHLPRPLSREAIDRYIADHCKNKNRFNRAFNSLKAISLVVEKSLDDCQESRFELHPLVKTFVRTEFAGKEERERTITSLIVVCNDLILELIGNTSVHSLEQFVTKVDLELDRGDVEAAALAMSTCKYDLLDNGLQEEFIRLSRQIFEKADWDEAEQWSQHLFSLSTLAIARMIELGRKEEAFLLLDRIESKISAGTVHYIEVCDSYCYAEWFCGDFANAIKWGEKGTGLKVKSDVDTQYDCGYNLALAKRDDGQVPEALEYFLAGLAIETWLEKDHTKEGRSAEAYGNIGRCLFLQGDFEKALEFFARSLDILEKEGNGNHLNRGYGAAWIADALIELEDNQNAEYFYRRSIALWKERAPHKADSAIEKLNALDKVEGIDVVDNAVAIECKKWVSDFLERKTPVAKTHPNSGKTQGTPKKNDSSSQNS